MRHEADDGAARIGYAGDIAATSIGIDVQIASYDESVTLESIQCRLVCDVATLAILQWDDDLVARGEGVGPDRVDSLHAQALIAADEVQVVIAGQRTGEQLGLAQDLEAIADAEHRQALTRALHDGAHHRGEACDGTAAQVVAVGKSTGQDHGVHTLEVVIAMPQGDRISSGEAHRARCIAVIERAREGDDTDLHC